MPQELSFLLTFFPLSLLCFAPHNRVQAFDCVESRAVAWAAFTLGRMMSGCPSDVLGRLVDTGAELALIGRGQLTCDIPPHAFMRKSAADGA